MLGRLAHSRAILVAVAVLATATLTGGIAWAVISPVSGGVVHGCYNPATGGLQLKVTTACPKTGNKTPINWSVTGPKGATGLTGPSDVYIGKTTSTPIGLGVPAVVTSVVLPAGSYLITAKTEISTGTTDNVLCTITKGSTNYDSTRVWITAGEPGEIVDTTAVGNQPANSTLSLVCYGNANNESAIDAVLTATRTQTVHG